MNTPEGTQIENSETPPFSVDDLNSKLNELEVVEGDLFGKGKSVTEIISTITRIRQEAINHLALEKERFAKVFITSNGSVYFNLSTGETLRAKKISNKQEFGEGEDEHYKFQPIMTELFFISKDELDRTEHLREYPGETLKTEDYQLGVRPLELNVYNFGSRIITERTDKGIWLKGSEWGEDKEIDTEGNLFGGIHIGHQIVQIIK